MNAYVILVDFVLEPGMRARFRRAIDANARASCGTEPGCRRFDVLEPVGEPDRILLYEIYDSRAAFEEHLKAPHLATFEAESAGLVRQKTVSEYSLVCEGSLAAQPEEQNG
jgi:(4S)-4-hydroxy-5-phosphonooxypentane-2,3-dione isomerase